VLIWGQTHCFARYADLVPGTLFVHKNKAAASCRTPSASRLPPLTASAAARKSPLGSAVRLNRAVWGQTRCLWCARRACPALRTTPWAARRAVPGALELWQTVFWFPCKQFGLFHRSHLGLLIALRA